MKERNYFDRLLIAAQKQTKEKEYWLNKLSGTPPGVPFPYDYKKGKSDKHALKEIPFEWTGDVHSKLISLSNRSDARLHIVMVAGTAALLNKYTGSRDMIVGTPIYKPESEGDFINTVLPLRMELKEDVTFKELLLQVQQTIMAADEHRDYPIEVLLQQLGMSYVPFTGENFPLFDMSVLVDTIHHIDHLSHINSNLIFRFKPYAHGLAGTIAYNPFLYERDTIERIIAHLLHLLEKVLFNLESPLWEIEIITEEEKREVLVGFNNTRAAYPRDKTIDALFEEQAAKTPDCIALVGKAQSAERRAQNKTRHAPCAIRHALSYRESNKKSSQLAHLLQEKGVETDTIVGIMVERSTAMVIGILGILKSGGAYVPLNPKAPAARSKYLLEECRARILVSEVSEVSGVSGNIEVIDLIGIMRNIGPIGPIVHRLPTHLCYVIFTSGSTGKPKGVPITHANLCPLLHWGYSDLGLGTKDRFIQNLSYYFDWSVWEIVMAITTGAGLYMVPDELLLDPEACIDFMNQNAITVLHVTPTQYQYFVNVGRKLETLKYLFIGAEKLSRELVEQSFESVNEDCRVFNMYGPTECTIISAVLEIERSDVKKFENLSSVPIGGPVANIELLVLDKYENPQPIGVMGELYIGGDCVSRGYLNNPELTAERFNRSYKSYRTYTFYKTGDLVRWLPTGPPAGGPSKIEFLGRIDFQVKIRGFRIELGEIESQLVTHDLIREAVVIDREKENSERYLCGYIVSKKDFDLTELKEYLSKHLPDYMIPSYFMQIERIPLNPNGKLDRRALPVPDLHGGELYAPPSDEIEEKLTAIWWEVLGIETEKISVNANFFELGGHSLNAALLTAKIHKSFDVKVPLKEVFLLPTVRKLATYIREAAEDKYAAVEPVEKKEYYVLSSAQKRLYILQQMTPQSLVYNMPQVIPLDMAIDKEKLQETFKRLIRRHESLRTSFIMVNKEPVQRINKLENYKFQITNYKQIPNHKLQITKKIRNFVRSFDLSQAPLLRVGLIQLEEKQYIFMMDMHHIITDGVSQGIFVKEFMAVYNNSGVSLPPLRLQYKDYAEWQAHDRQVYSLKRQKQYWLERFAGELPILDLPYDYPRPGIQSYEGSHNTFFIGSEEAAGLKALAAEEDATLYMVLLAIFNLLLNRLSGQEDIIVGSPVAGRRHADLQDIIGMFVNTLAMRNYPSAEKTVLSFLRDVKESTLEAFENQDYAFEDLVEKVSVARDVGRNPVFDVMFALQNLGEQQDAVHKGDGYESGIAKFDITLAAVTGGDTIDFSLEYCTKLFNKETIRRFIQYFKNIISSIVNDPGQRLSDIQLITEAEKRQILEDFNDTNADYPKNKTIHQLFAEQARRTPDAVAVQMTHRTDRTYKKLNEESNRLAYLLQEKGVKPGSIVAIMVERSLEMMIGIFGILKAGGAYLPIDPGYPEERTRYMLEDSGAKVLLTNLPEGHHLFNCQLLMSLPAASLHHSSFITHHSDLAYIIYTSGSTGQPKGVMIEHTSVVNRLNWMQRAYPIGAHDVILQKTTYTFDVSVWELFWWSFQGARLCLLGPGEEKDPGAIAKAVTDHHVTTMHFVPSMLNVFLDYLENDTNGPHLTCLKQVFASGEALKKDQVERFHRLLNPVQTKLINLYGPTEATVDVSYFDCSEVEHFTKVPIGKPIDNIRLYVMDKGFFLQPVGIAGELFISGVGVARGYLNRPELTEEKFPPAGGPSYPTHLTHPLTHSPIYRTGDLARWLPSGNIEFLGRIDHQVKVRGFRIELGEIESCLIKSPPVKEAVVAARPDSTGDNQLAAYVVPDETVAFTVNRLIQMEKEDQHADRLHYDLPNGMPIFYLNRHETDFMYREIFKESSYLKHGITLREGACIFDIGANIGLFSLFANTQCNNAEIYSFEPVPPLYELLKLNTSLYGNNFRVFKNGISSTREEAVFTYYPHATLLSGRFADGREEKETVKAFIEQELKEMGENKPSEDQIDELLQERLAGVQFPCSMKPLSQVIRENGVERIDLLKIDVEKSELDVLNGIDEQDWSKIQQLVIEVHDSENNGILDQVRGMLENHGYAVKVEQDSMLEETGLYNVYAVSPTRDQGEEVEILTAHTWYSPDQLVKDLRESLKGQLPDYMVPSHFVLMDRLPLTASGKINRRSLPEPELKAGKAYEAPVNEVEEKLVNIWSEVLGMEGEHISVTARFFELGGHSLKAAGMVSGINREFKVNVPLIQIFTTPTIRQLAAYVSGLAGESDALEDDRLVRLKKGSNHGHLFLVHDGSGEVEAYIELCRLLAVDIDCWGIRAQGFAGYAPHNLRVEEIAETYVQKIQKVQPHGPYAIAGWSLGGTIAFEMVRQLEGVGEAVIFFALVDTLPPKKDLPRLVGDFTVSSESEWLSTFLGNKEIVASAGKTGNLETFWLSVVKALEQQGAEVENIRKQVPDYVSRVIPNFDRLTLQELIYHYNVTRTFVRACDQYRPEGKIKTTVHFFAAGRANIQQEKQWQEYSDKPVEFYEINGDHFSILKPPGVEALAKRFEPFLS